MITLKIDVTKIDKSRLYKGAKGTYLNCTMIDTPTSEYGDYMIVEETTKEEREAGKKGTILGNAKIIKPKSEPTQTKSNPFTQPAATTAPVEDNLPF
jgi:hypothetical protein